ncbi:hypothetical protein K3729_17025 [Rhodobacteraceae bacterium S2214]|nr:hypothetical protein K3729_17025 [Rhodobacteraceae bacterium S2214]
MPRNRENIIRLTCEFLDKLPEATRQAENVDDQLTNNTKICAALQAALGEEDKGGLTANVVKNIRSKKVVSPKPEKSIWVTLENAICAFKTDGYPELAALQSEIMAFAALKDDSFNDTITTLFHTNNAKIHFAPELIGEYIVYRQISETTAVVKSLLSITAQPSNSAMRFHFGRLDHPYTYRFARGRVLELEKCFTLVGALYDPDGKRLDGLMMSSIAKMDEHKINENELHFASGLHTMSGDYTEPCSSKLVIIRSDHEKELQQIDVDLETGAIRKKAEVAIKREEKASMTFDDAVLELKFRTQLDFAFLRHALSNEISEPTDTLHYARQIY